ncbi:MAG: hypothetical protein RRY42_07340, partial [Mucinivorans sp.]
MKNLIITLAMVLVASTASAQYVDDLYGTPVRSPKRTKTTSTQSTQSVQNTNNNTNYSHSTAGQALQSASSTSDAKELITSYDEALRRRLNAMRNASDQPESYWVLMEQYQAMLESKYNQHLYNIVVVGDEMWVEPQGITALFTDSDPAAGVIQYNNEIRKNGFSSTNNYGKEQTQVTIQVNVVDPWDVWRYSSWYSPFYSSYYNWSRPYHSYWGGGWGGYCHPYWGGGWGGYYPPYWGGGWGGGYYPPYWGGGWNNGWNGGWNNYYRSSNPKGTYYGNTRYGNSTYYPGGSGVERPTPRPNGVNGGMGGGVASNRPNARPNGNNTLDGVTGRPTQSGVGVGSSRPNSSRPNYER